LWGRASALPDRGSLVFGLRDANLLSGLDRVRRVYDDLFSARDARNNLQAVAVVTPERYRLQRDLAVGADDRNPHAFGPEDDGVDREFERRCLAGQLQMHFGVRSRQQLALR